MIAFQNSILSAYAREMMKCVFNIRNQSDGSADQAAFSRQRETHMQKLHFDRNLNGTLVIRVSYGKARYDNVYIDLESPQLTICKAKEIAFLLKSVGTLRQ